MDYHIPVTPMIRYPPSNNSLLSSGNARKVMAYEPRTEAISPALNDDVITTDDSTSKPTKDEQTILVEKLKRVEAEILQTDLQISRLRKQKAQLEQAASCVSNDDEDQENVCDTKQLSIAKLVYHENRAKAQKAHSKLDGFAGPTKDLPLYNQPSDTAVYHYNAAKFATSFKNSLIVCFRERLQSRLKLEESVSAEYNRRMENWLKRCEQEDTEASKRLRDAKMREFFEKQFPELKKARESGERFSRVGHRVARSDAELDEILDGITEREDQDKKVKSYAVIPPMLEEMRSKKPKYINRNGYVEDIIAEYKEYLILNTWTEEEKDIFRENYLQQSKNFGYIARMTSRKSVANCVQYYYMSKKSENYKQLLKRQQKRRTRSFVRPQQQTPAVVASESNEDTSKTENNNSNDKNCNETSSADASAPNISEQENDSKTNSSNQTSNPKETGQDESNVAMQENQQNSAPICCICSCEFSETNQSRNVTRSNHQLYGIRINNLKPGMKICYSCRFRHVKHPSFDAPSVSPEPQEEQENFEPMDSMDQPMNISNQQPVLDNESDPSEKHCISNDQQISQPGDLMGLNPAINGDISKGQQRGTCVRDIIYQAIEMSFKKPPTPESKMLEATVKSEAIQPEKLNPNVIPIRQHIPNQSIANPIPTHRPMQNLDQHRFQVHMQQKQQQMQMEYSLRQQQILTHQIQQQQIQLQQQRLQLEQQRLQHQQLQVQRHPIPVPTLPVVRAQHPLNLCRSFKSTPTTQAPAAVPSRAPPPIAHGGSKVGSKDEYAEEDGVLNLCKTTKEPEVIKTNQQHQHYTEERTVIIEPQRQIIEAQRMSVEPPPRQIIEQQQRPTVDPQLQPPPQPLVAPPLQVVEPSRQVELARPDTEPAPDQQVAESTERQPMELPQRHSEDNPVASLDPQQHQSPNMTEASDTSPSEMVIDESAEIHSPEQPL